MYLNSLLSPLGLFITYFFNACIAHNLYITFYTYRNNFDARMKIYKLIALVGGIITILLSLLFNNRQNQSSVQFTVSYYPFFFIALFYFIGGVTIIYMIIKISYVIRERGSFFNFLKESENSSKNYLITLFVKRHLSFLLFFFICFVPNNIILLLQIFMSYKICTNCSYYSIFIYLMSLSGGISFFIKLSEPYMKKYIVIVLNFVLRKDESQNEENQSKTDYVDLYTNDGGLLEGDKSLQGKNENDVKQMEEYKLQLNSSTKDSNNEVQINNYSEKRGSYFNKKKISTTELKNMADTLNVFTKEMEASDFFIRMIGITISTEEDKHYDFDPAFGNKTKSYLPWEDEAYNEKSDFMEYTHKNLPEWLASCASSKII